MLVSSNIVGAEVYVDGRRVDDAPALVEQLAPGKHVVEVRAKGHTSTQTEAVVEEGKTTKVAITLKPDQATIARLAARW